MGGACSTHERNVRKIFLVNPKGNDQLGDLGVCEKIILEEILGKQVGGCGLDASSSKKGGIFLAE
jgi:hypothetical protein